MRVSRSTSTTMLFCWVGWNPVAETMTLYVPFASWVRVNRPSALVLVVTWKNCVDVGDLDLGVRNNGAGRDR